MEKVLHVEGMMCGKMRSARQERAGARSRS